MLGDGDHLDVEPWKERQRADRRVQASWRRGPTTDRSWHGVQGLARAARSCRRRPARWPAPLGLDEPGELRRDRRQAASAPRCARGTPCQHAFPVIGSTVKHAGRLRRQTFDTRSTRRRSALAPTGARSARGSPSTTIDRGAPPSIRLASRSTASLPICRTGSDTVVSGGLRNSASSLSWRATSETSSGTDSPRSRKPADRTDGHHHRRHEHRRRVGMSVEDPMNPVVAVAEVPPGHVHGDRFETGRAQRPGVSAAPPTRGVDRRRAEQADDVDVAVVEQVAGGQRCPGGVVDDHAGSDPVDPPVDEDHRAVLAPRRCAG